MPKMIFQHFCFFFFVVGSLRADAKQYRITCRQAKMANIHADKELAKRSWSEAVVTPQFHTARKPIIQVGPRRWRHRGGSTITTRTHVPSKTWGALVLCVRGVSLYECPWQPEAAHFLKYLPQRTHIASHIARKLRVLYVGGVQGNLAESRPKGTRRRECNPAKRRLIPWVAENVC